MGIHWTEHWTEIARRFQAAPRVLAACDFDGTLAPLHPDPAAVRLPDAALQALERLRAGRGVTVAVISGRSLADIVARVPLEDAVFAGNHGLEIRGLGLDGERSQAASLRPQLEAMAARLAGCLSGVSGLLIENKGVSVSVHYRHVAEGERSRVFQEIRTAARAAGEQAGSPSCFRIQEGHLVMEVLPDIGWNKGAAMRQMAARLGLPGCAAFYAGDDTTDETVFKAFPTALTVHVEGTRKFSAARWRARDPADVCRLLNELAALRGAA